MQLTKQSYDHAYAYVLQARANIILAIHTAESDSDVNSFLVSVRLKLEAAMGMLQQSSSESKMTPIEALNGPLRRINVLHYFTDTDQMKIEIRKRNGLSTNNAIDVSDDGATVSSDEDTEPQPLG